MNTVTFPVLGLELEINRVAFTIFGKDIYWYGIIIAAGFMLALVYAYFNLKNVGLNSDQLIDYLLWGTIFAIIGARLYYVIFNFSTYRNNPIEIFYIWNGGIAIYGSIIGAFLTGYIMSKKKRINTYRIFDLASVGFLIGQCIGRWGNFVNAEAYGKAFESQNIADLPFWAMGININGVMTYIHPIFLYESLWNLIGIIILLTRIKKRHFGGEMVLFYMGWYGFGRFFTEGIRGGDELYLFSTNIRVSQLLGALLFIISLAVFIWKFTHKDRTGPLGMSAFVPLNEGIGHDERVAMLYPDPPAKEPKTDEAEEEEEDNVAEEETDEAESDDEPKDAEKEDDTDKEEENEKDDNDGDNN